MPAGKGRAARGANAPHPHQLGRLGGVFQRKLCAKSRLARRAYSRNRLRRGTDLGEEGSRHARGSARTSASRGTCPTGAGAGRAVFREHLGLAADLLYSCLVALLQARQRLLRLLHARRPAQRAPEPAQLRHQTLRQRKGAHSWRHSHSLHCERAPKRTFTPPGKPHNKTSRLSIQKLAHLGSPTVLRRTRNASRARSTVARLASTAGTDLNAFLLCICARHRLLLLRLGLPR